METSWNLTTTSDFQDEYYISTLLSHTILPQKRIYLEKVAHKKSPYQWISLIHRDILKVLKKLHIRSKFHATEYWQWEYGAKEEMTITSALGKSCSKTLHIELQLLPHPQSWDKQMKGCKRTNPTCLPSKLISTYSGECSLISWRPLHTAHTKIDGIKRTRLVFTWHSLSSS